MVTQPDEIEQAMGLIRPLRLSYTRPGYRGTTVSKTIAIDMATDPSKYASEMLKCGSDGNLYPASEFRWYNPDGTVSDEVVGE